MKKAVTYCGTIAIVGRSNVGKSTLMNYLLGKKVSITSKKPQTTRHCIIGIHTEGIYQSVYVDTPGLHIKEQKIINRLMNRAASRYINNSELIIFVIEGTNWSKDDQLVMNKIRNSTSPILLVINKIDTIANKENLLSHVKTLYKEVNFHSIIPVCAENGKNVNFLSVIIRKMLPKSPHYFPETCFTDYSNDFFASEIIREKLMRFLGKELPYSITVKIERFIISKNGNYNINGIIFVERESQKKIVIGKDGSKLKIIGIQSRKEMENIFKTSVYLELWVKVNPGWNNDKQILYSLGYS